MINRKLINKNIRLYLSFRNSLLFLSDSIDNDMRMKKEDIEIAEGMRIIPILKKF